MGPSIDSNISILNPTSKDPNFLQLYSITIPSNSYSAISLTNEINTQLKNATFLTNSSFDQYNISDNDPNSNSYFQFNLQLNRNTTVNQQNAKLAVLLPNDLFLNIWTSPTSCFRFTSNQSPINEISGNNTYSYIPFYINTVNSEYISLQTNYIIGNSVQMIFKCITAPWDVSQNNVTITIPPSTTGYILNDYIKTINNSIAQNSIFNTANSYSFIGSTDSAFHLRLDMNKSFNQSTYLLDLSNTDLLKAGFTFIDNNNNPLNLNSPFDLSINNVFNFTLENTTQFSLNTDDKLMQIYVNPNYTYIGNQNDSSYNVIFTNNNTNGQPYISTQTLQNDINTSIQKYQNPISKLNPLLNTLFIINPINPNTNDGKYHGTMTITIKNALTESDYTLSFIDPSHSWYNNFDINDNSTGIRYIVWSIKLFNHQQHLF